MMKTRKIPMRKCIVSKEAFPKKDLIRVVVDKEKQVSVDQGGKMNGRGAYLKFDLKTINEAKKTKALERALGVNNIDEIYEELVGLINE